jgi:hypothetical protein
LAVDQIEDQAELSRLQSPVMLEGFKKMSLPGNSDLEYVVRQLQDLCNEAISGKSWTKPLANSEPGGKTEQSEHSSLRIWD